jgi:long-chain acyl-CoA synthetase
MIENVSNETAGRLNQLFDKIALSRSEAIALVYEDRRISFFELQLYIDWMAGYFQSINLQSGQRVALLLPNLPKLVISFFGLLRAGGVAVPLDVSSEAHELRSALLFSKAVAVITTPECKPLLDHALAESPGHNARPPRVTVALFEEDNIVTLNKPPRERPAAAEPGRIVPPSGLSDHARSRNQNGTQTEEGKTSADFPAVLYFKENGEFCARTHDELEHEADEMIRRIHLTADDRLLCLAPLSQKTCLGNFLIAGVAAGATQVLLEPADWESILQTLVSEGITVLVTPPAFLRRLLENKIDAALPVRWCFCTGASLSPEIGERLQQKLGFKVEQLTAAISTGILQ